MQIGKLAREERREEQVKKMIRKYVKELDDLHHGYLIAYSWPADGIAGYRVIAERFYSGKAEELVHADR